MEKVVLKRCCDNCEWSISPQCEAEIMKENHYTKDDPTRPRAGDCCLGRKHDENYFCDSHEYIANCLQTYTFYEDKYLGPGYFIVSEYEENIIKFFKLYRTGTYGDYNYGIVVYEFDPMKVMNKIGVTIPIRKSDGEVLYKAITIFAEALKKDVIYDVEKNNFMSCSVYKYSTFMCFIGNNDNNIIDVKIDNKNERIYKLVEHLYRNMAVTTMNKSNDKAYAKVRKITKKM